MRNSDRETRICVGLASILSRYPRIGFAAIDQVEFEGVRMSEPNLASSAKEGGQMHYFGLAYDGEISGVLSFFLEENVRRRPRASFFGRVDLVVVRERFRKRGIGNALVVCALVQMLSLNKSRLYSISSLAAHDAMAAILRRLGFLESIRQGKEYRHEELRLDEGDAASILVDWSKVAEEDLRVLNFRMRQDRGALE